MATYDSTAQNGSVDQLEQRDVRARTQCLTVLDDGDRAVGAEDLYLVVSQSGESYLVDAREGACECPDHEYRDVQCKHRRRVAFATGEGSISGWIDRDGVDPDLGEHVAGEVRFAGDNHADGDDQDDAADPADAPIATDGGEVLECATERPGYSRHVEAWSRAAPHTGAARGVAGKSSSRSVATSSSTPRAARWDVNERRGSYVRRRDDRFARGARRRGTVPRRARRGGDDTRTFRVDRRHADADDSAGYGEGAITFLYFDGYVADLPVSTVEKQIADGKIARGNA